MLKVCNDQNNRSTLRNIQLKSHVTDFRLGFYYSNYSVDVVKHSLPWCQASGGQKCILPTNLLAQMGKLVRLRVDLPGHGAQMLLSSPTFWWEQRLPETLKHTQLSSHTPLLSVSLSLSLLSVSISLCFLQLLLPNLLRLHVHRLQVHRDRGWQMLSTKKGTGRIMGSQLKLWWTQSAPVQITAFLPDYIYCSV